MNALANSTSPYLRAHADNPVDWVPWSADAFEQARRRNVPVLVSIGYSTCHWCHVMARESFSDPDVAQVLNRDFVCIKVDREELPVVDSFYMDALQAMRGQGGWPLTAFADHDGVPFFAGTYFPPTSRPGLPAFRAVLEAVTNTWRDQQDQIAKITGTLGPKLFEVAQDAAVDLGDLGANASGLGAGSADAEVSPAQSDSAAVARSAAGQTAESASTPHVTDSGAVPSADFPQTGTAPTDRSQTAAPATAEPTAGPLTDPAPTAEDLDSAYDHLAQSFDPRHGGFGGAPKFPPTLALQAMLTSLERIHDRLPAAGTLKLRVIGTPAWMQNFGANPAHDRLAVVRFTLANIAAGGMRDQVRGGIARYSVDATWTVPHFEKMLGDNAMYLRLTAAWLKFEHGVDPHSPWAALAQREVTGTAGFIRRDLVRKTAGRLAVGSGLDADSLLGEASVEGAFYTFTDAHLAEALSSIRGGAGVASDTHSGPGAGVDTPAGGCAAAGLAGGIEDSVRHAAGKRSAWTHSGQVAGEFFELVRPSEVLGHEEVGGQTLPRKVLTAPGILRWLDAAVQADAAVQESATGQEDAAAQEDAALQAEPTAQSSGGDAEAQNSPTPQGAGEGEARQSPSGAVPAEFQKPWGSREVRAIMDKLQRVQDQRSRPRLDEKSLTAETALTAIALLEAADVLGDEELSKLGAELVEGLEAHRQAARVNRGFTSGLGEQGIGPDGPEAEDGAAPESDAALDPGTAKAASAGAGDGLAAGGSLFSRSVTDDRLGPGDATLADAAAVVRAQLARTSAGATQQHGRGADAMRQLHAILAAYQQDGKLYDSAPELVTGFRLADPLDGPTPAGRALLAETLLLAAGLDSEGDDSGALNPTQARDIAQALTGAARQLMATAPRGVGWSLYAAELELLKR